MPKILQEFDRDSFQIDQVVTVAGGDVNVDFVRVDSGWIRGQEDLDHAHSCLDTVLCIVFVLLIEKEKVETTTVFSS